MKKFRISVNGKSYDVEVEEIGAQSSAPVYTAPAAKPAQTTPLQITGRSEKNLSRHPRVFHHPPARLWLLLPCRVPLCR